MQELLNKVYVSFFHNNKSKLDKQIQTVMKQSKCLKTDQVTKYLKVFLKTKYIVYIFVLTAVKSESTI